jgi:branched-subunit amino acid transport protein
VTWPSTWIAVLAASAACYGFKLAGLSLPERVLRDARVERVGLLLPVALLSALALTQTLTTGRAIDVDARLVAVAVASVAVWRRAPFLVVIGLAVGVAAGLRALT